MEFHAAHPGVALSIREMPQAGVLEGIRRQELDFGIGPRPAQCAEPGLHPADGGGDRRPGAAALRPRRGGSIALAALGALPVIITSGTNSMRAMVEEAAASIGVSFQLRCEVQMPETAIALAATGLGVAIVPQLALVGRRLAGLRLLRISDPPLLREVGIVQLRGNRLSPAATTFQELLRARLVALPLPAADAPPPDDPGVCAMTSPSRAAEAAAPGGSKPARRRGGKRVSASD